MSNDNKKTKWKELSSSKTAEVEIGFFSLSITSLTIKSDDGIELELDEREIIRLISLLREAAPAEFE